MGRGFLVGYLKCEKCGGYYELQEGESPDDFEDTCECGGKLKYVESLDSFSDEPEDKTPTIDDVPLSKDKSINEPITSKDISQGRFCPKCGKQNTLTATFCKKCGYDFKTGSIPPTSIRDLNKAKNSPNDDKKSLQSKFTNKKVLIPIVVVLLVLVALGGYSLYQNYRMQQMDANMVQYQAAMAKYWSKSAETEVLTNSTPINYDQIYSNIDTMNANLKEAKSYGETAYQYADGPYKDFINQQIKVDDMLLSENSFWKQRVQYVQQNNFVQAGDTKKLEENVANQVTNLSNDMSTFLSTHPEVKQHANQYWNFNIQ
jgi:ribosomal protein L40E/predicted negative regulator of RcsB-dependent stress response